MKHINDKIIIERICLILKNRRVEKGESIDSMALRLGYKDASTYSKFERGEVERIDLFKLKAICDILELSVANLCTAAGLNIIVHKTAINNWVEFWDSLKGCDDAHLKRIMQFITPPSQEKPN